MSDVHSALLRANHDTLCADLSLNELVAKLYSRRVLTDLKYEEYEELGPASRTKLAKRLLMTLAHKPDKAFGEFVRALLETDQSHLATLLIPDLG